MIKQIGKKILAMLMTLAMMVILLPAMTLPANAVNVTSVQDASRSNNTDIGKAILTSEIPTYTANEADGSSTTIVNYVGNIVAWGFQMEAALKFQLPATSSVLSFATLHLPVVNVKNSPTATVTLTDDNSWQQTDDLNTSIYPSLSNATTLLNRTITSSGDVALPLDTTKLAAKISSSGTTDITLIVTGSTTADNYFNFIADDDTSTDQAYLVLTFKPQVQSVSVPVNGTYKIGDALNFTVTFDSVVIVTGTPRIPVTLNTGGTVYASYVSGSNSKNLVFRYTVSSEDLDADGITLGNVINLNSGTINNSVGDSAELNLYSVAATTSVRVDGVAPSISSVSPPGNATYSIGDNLDYTVNFNEPINVVATGGTPYITLTVGSSTVQAAYQSGTGGSALTFRYTVVAGDADEDGVALSSNITLNGGTLKDAAGNNATLTFTGSTAADVKVSTVPTVTTTSVSTYTTTMATMGGNVIADGGASVTERGVVYSSTDATPTIGEAGVTKDANGTGTGSFSELVTGLSPSTTYHVRSYAINSVGTSYGSVTSFATAALAITSATYNAGTGVLAVTGANMTTGDTIAVNKLTLTGDGGSTYTLTSGNVTADNATSFSVTLNATDKAAVNQILNKNGTSSTSGTTYNLAAADDWDSNVAAGDTSDSTGNGITVNNAAPNLTSINPNNGPAAGGTSVTIIGQNFTGANAVKFGGTNATTFTVNSDIQITATAPSGSGTVNVTVTTASGTSAGVQYAYAAPTVTLSVDNASIVENAGVATVTATLSAASVSEVTVTLGYTGSATGGGIDYTASSTTITIPVGSTAGTATITAANDTLDEMDETVVVDITGVTNGTENGMQQVTVTITDDDAAPTISVNDTLVDEGNAGNATLSFTVTLSTASGKLVTVDYATADGTATAGTDYTINSGTLIFSEGETSKTVSVTVAGDTVTEPDETVLLNLSTSVNATIADNQGSGTLTNDDAVPGISVNDVSVAEGNAGTSTLTFTVSLDHASASIITVNYATADNTAAAGTDYTAVSGTLTFAADDTSETVSVTISGDTGYEPDESFYINLLNPINATITNAQGVGTITNDDAAPTVTLSVDNASIVENTEVATVTATLSAASMSEVTVTLGYTGTATGGGTDYIAASTTITIAAGSTTGTATITAVSDTLDEVDETVIVDITGVTNGNESVPQQVTTTITDDDAEPTISVNDPTVAEGNAGNATLTFTVTLSTASGKTITVDYSTADGTATTADSDYTASNGTLTFNVGETTKQIPVTVTGDTKQEAGETVLLNLSNPVNATISDSQGSGTISDNDTIYDSPSTPATPPQSAVVEVNGEKQDAGQMNTQTTGGTTTTTITVDDTKLDKILEQKGNNATVTLPASGNPDVFVGQLTGQTVKNMETKEAVLEIKTETVTYTLPASQINIDNVSAQLGAQVELKDIKVNVKIAEPPADKVKIVENTASRGNYQLVVKPVEFQITCTSVDTTVEVNRFNGYVERTIAIPDGIDPSKITTGIVLNTDGTFSHVPTSIVLINGKYFAKINSLTNSTYSVIYNPVTFTDVASHWAKDAVNDMGSRMVVTGIGGIYEPERSITRAEFAAIVVRAMGLKKGTTESAFGDVTLTDWFNGYVDTATSYNLITGYDSSSFAPNDTITREQAMTILARAMKLTGLSVKLTDSEASALLANYTDSASISDYAKAGTAACIKMGVVSGTTASTLSPKDSVTRAEVAVMVQRLLQKSGLI